jgi:hypothetical protein
MNKITLIRSIIPKLNPISCLNCKNMYYKKEISKCNAFGVVTKTNQIKHDDCIVARTSPFKCGINASAFVQKEIKLPHYNIEEIIDYL